MRKLTLLLVAVALIAVIPGEAKAGLIVYLDAGGGNTQAVNGVGGVAAFNGALGNWTINITTGLSNPLLTNEIDLLSLNATCQSNCSGGASGGTLSMWISDTDFALGTGSREFISSIGGTTNGTVGYQSYYDPTNAERTPGGPIPLTAILLASSGGMGGPAFSYGNITNAGVGPGHFSLLEVITITHGPGGNNPTKTTSLDANLRVPEPTTMTLLGLGFLALGFVRRRR